MENILRTIAIALTVLLCTGSVFAVPAKRTKITMQQSDGTKLVVSQRGDEHLHYFVTDDDLPLTRKENGDFYHAIIEDGKIVPSEIMAHNTTQRTEQERKFIAKRGDISSLMSEIHQAKVSLRNAARANNIQTMRTAGQTTYEGNKHALVILVNFKNNKFSIPSPKEHFLRKLNEKGYSEDKCHGSVSEYFSDQSNGKFNLTFDVAGPYTLSQDMAYYGGNSNGNDIRPREMAEEACKMAAEDVDYSIYDWFGDGYVDMVFVVYAGYNEAQGGAKETVWAHQWDLKSPLFLNGKYISTYACSSELAGKDGTTPDGIGTFCHEFSHCLGLPDLYDTNNSGTVFGMDRWSLMDYGTYLGENENGGCPCYYTTYERMCCGWSTPEELNAARNVQNMKPLDSNNTGYIIYNESNRNEYYILDNRQKQGWDSYLPGHGLLVTHVDYDKSAWYNNNVNTNISHLRCTIIHADNQTGTDFKDLAGDPFPGITGKTELSDTSIPAASLFNDNTNGTKLMGKPITEITESANGLIAFKFMGGTGSAIIDTTIKDANSNGMIAPYNYRQLLPKSIKIEKRGDKTIKTIDVKFQYSK